MAGLAAGLLTVVLWGSAFVGIRAAGESFSPGSLALARLIVSGALLTAVAVYRRESLPPRRALVTIAIYGVMWLAVYSTTLNAAERIVDAGTAAMLISSGPVLTAVLAGYFLKEGFPRWLFIGCAIALAGAAMIGFATARSGMSGPFGIALLVIAAVAYGSAVVVQKSALRRASSFQVTWLGVMAALIVCLPFFAPALATEAAKAGPSAIGWAVYLGAFPTALGFASWSFALKRTTAGRTAALNYLVPVVAVLLGWALLAETPPWLAIAGGVLCLAGVYVARRR